MIHYSDCDCGGWESMCEGCQEQLWHMEEHIKDLQQFVKAWDELNPKSANWGDLERLLTAREKIGVIG